MTRISFGLTGLNQLGPKCRGCVFVQLDFLNIRFGFFVCLTEWWSHKWRGPRRWQVHKHPKHTHIHTHTRLPTGTSLEGETVEFCQEERSWASCASVRRLQEIGCVCVCVWVDGTWCWDSSRLPLAHSESPRRCRILASSSRRPSCSARRRPETQNTQKHALLEEFSINTSHENDLLLIYSTCFNTSKSEFYSFKFMFLHFEAI